MSSEYPHMKRIYIGDEWIYPGEYPDDPAKPQIRIKIATPNLKPLNPEDPEFKGDIRYIRGDWNTIQEAIDSWEENKGHFLKHRDARIPLIVTVQATEVIVTESKVLFDYIPPNP
jgi:hypothetical protein